MSFELSLEEKSTRFGGDSIKIRDQEFGFTFYKMSCTRAVELTAMGNPAIMGHVPFCSGKATIRDSDDSIYRNIDNIEFDIDISNRIVKKYRIFRYIAILKKISRYF